MIEPARFDALLRLFLRFSNDRVKELPVAPEVLLKDTRAELLTLSELTRSLHCGTQDIFGIWGNRDGAVFASEGVFSVCYNESMPRRRVRFTLAEELMHIVLGHVGSGEFNIFEQSFSREMYSRYEEEAKLFAGLLLCPPAFFRRYSAVLDAGVISAVCDVSEECASRVIATYNEYSERIFSSVLYSFGRLPVLSEKSRKALYKAQSIKNEVR